ncbi:MAG: molecular chaperone DnaJ [Chloroflexi bacterium]|nr:molecular chaperone DnaJ [Chloroflexota bacterium]
MATQRDYYEVLGIPRSADDSEIKRAFRRLAQQWHPDVNTEHGADERFKEVNEAYQILSDPQRRQAYDMFGRAGVGGLGGDGQFGGFQGFGDLFDAFFGGAAAGATGSRRQRQPSGSDLRYDLRLTFDEAIRGAEKEIEFSAFARCETCTGSGAAPGTEPITCPQCHGTGEQRQIRSTMLGQMVNVTACPRCRGQGRIVESLCETCRGDGRVERKRTIRVTIPAGIDDGHQIRLSGEGEAGPRGGPPGNLYVVVHATPHPELRREDTELYYELMVSIAQASLGARVMVPTPDGAEPVEIKPGTQPGTEIRLRGRGVPHLRRTSIRGDLHVLVDVKVPSRLSARQRELLEEFAVESGDQLDLPAEDPDPGGGTNRRGRRQKGLFDKVKDAIS